MPAAAMSALRPIRGGVITRRNVIAAASTASSSAHPAWPASAYVHLPFCKRKCFYCDFPVEAVGRNTEKQHIQDRMHDYVKLVCTEIKATARMNSGPLQTVYFGGGTPSLVPPHLIAEILQALDSRFGIAAGAEVSLEADPGTFDLARLKQYTAMGVSRISMGVQAFDQGLLESCGRAHSLADVYNAVEAVHASGVRSWSLDLISGLPKLTLPVWQHSLQEAVKARPNHVSVYDLQVEEGTPFARWYRPGASPLPPDDLAVAMYSAASQVLGAAGFEHYEVSNYAQPGHRSRHNQVYWAGQQYYAFGLGAASYLGGRRFSRPAAMKQYQKWVAEFAAQGGLEAAAVPALSAAATAAATAARAGQAAEAAGRGGSQQAAVSGRSVSSTSSSSQGAAVAAGYGAQGGGAGSLPGEAEVPEESEEDQMLDRVMLALRTADGLDLVAFGQRHGQEAAQRVVRALRRHAREGRAELLEAPGHGQTAQGTGDAPRLGGEGAVSSSQGAGAREGAEQAKQGVLVKGSGKAVVRVRLTDPAGFLLSNDIISDVFAELSRLG